MYLCTINIMQVVSKSRISKLSCIIIYMYVNHEQCIYAQYSVTVKIH